MTSLGLNDEDDNNDLFGESLEQYMFILMFCYHHDSWWIPREAALRGCHCLRKSANWTILLALSLASCDKFGKFDKFDKFGKFGNLQILLKI